MLQPKNQRSEQNCVWLCYYFNFERNYDVLESVSPIILLNKNMNFNKDETESKTENSTHGSGETDLVCFSSYKNHKLKVKLWWVGARERKKEGIFCTVFFCPKEYFLTLAFYLNVWCIEYTFRKSEKNITSYTFLLNFEIVESLQCFCNYLLVI